MSGDGNICQGSYGYHYFSGEPSTFFYKTNTFNLSMHSSTLKKTVFEENTGIGKYSRSKIP